uniref:Uncharacterized protein n=1 Tax=viral metagenome TaxID=1070528 RepID=A0A6M3LQM9_9ZZZZ
MTATEIVNLLAGVHKVVVDTCKRVIQACRDFENNLDTIASIIEQMENKSCSEKEE